MSPLMRISPSLGQPHQCPLLELEHVDKVGLTGRPFKVGAGQPCLENTHGQFRQQVRKETHAFGSGVTVFFT